MDGAPETLTGLVLIHTSVSLLQPIFSLSFILALRWEHSLQTGNQLGMRPIYPRSGIAMGERNLSMERHSIVTQDP
jgi:hypothetical protein